MRIGSAEVCEGNATENGKTGGDRARWVISRGGGLLAGPNVAKPLFLIPLTMAGIIAIPTLEGGAVSGQLSG